MDDQPSFRRRRDVMRLVGAVLAPWVLFALAVALPLILRELHRAGWDAEWSGMLCWLWFFLFAVPALLTAPALWLLGVARLVWFRAYRRSVYGWLWLPLMHANAAAFALAAESVR